MSTSHSGGSQTEVDLRWSQWCLSLCNQLYRPRDPFAERIPRWASGHAVMDVESDKAATDKTLHDVFQLTHGRHDQRQSFRLISSSSSSSSLLPPFCGALDRYVLGRIDIRYVYSTHPLSQASRKLN